MNTNGQRMNKLCAERDAQSKDMTETLRRAVSCFSEIFSRAPPTSRRNAIHLVDELLYSFGLRCRSSLRPLRLLSLVSAGADPIEVLGQTTMGLQVWGRYIDQRFLVAKIES